MVDRINGQHLFREIHVQGFQLQRPPAGQRLELVDAFPFAARRPLECLHELAPQPVPRLPFIREPLRKVPSLPVPPLVDDQLPGVSASHAAQRLGLELQPAAVGVC